MTERTGDYEWRIEGEEAEALLYAPDETALQYPRLRSGLDAVAALPGVESPVYAAASPRGFGWASASSSHVAPGLVSSPRAGLLLAADLPSGRLGVPPEELPRLLARSLAEVAMPRLSEAELVSACESGAEWAAGEGLIDEEDLSFFQGYGLASHGGDPDTLSRRALAAGGREWDPRPEGDARALVVKDTQDSEAVEALGLHEGALVVVASAGAGELGRLALEGHSQRISSRGFEESEGMNAAPRVMEEAADLLAADAAISGYAAARASLLIYALRRALGEAVGGLSLACVWRGGGFEERGGLTVHRRSLARLEHHQPLVCGDSLASGAGAMLRSAPPFDAAGESKWPWEEAGLLERAARLHRPGER